MYGACMVSPEATTQVAARAVTAEMARQNLSQVDISTRTGIPRPTLQRRLSGFSPFTVDELDRIAHVLNVEVVSLMNGSAA